MTDINHVVIVGRIVADVESSRNGFGYTQSGYAVARVSVAVNRGHKQNDQWVEEASFFDVTVWGKTAESLRPYLKKGQQIAVEGFLKQERWEKDGQKYSRVGIVATSVQLCGSRQNGTGQQNGFRGQPDGYGAGAGRQDNVQHPPVYEPDGYPEDIPF